MPSRKVMHYVDKSGAFIPLSQLLDSAKSILGILKSENTNGEKKCFQISINHLCTGKPVHQNLT